jgi:hypothetical protein
MMFCVFLSSISGRLEINLAEIKGFNRMICRMMAYEPMGLVTAEDAVGMIPSSCVRALAEVA